MTCDVFGGTLNLALSIYVTSEAYISAVWRRGWLVEGCGTLRGSPATADVPVDVICCRSAVTVARRGTQPSSGQESVWVAHVATTERCIPYSTTPTPLCAICHSASIHTYHRPPVNIIFTFIEINR